MSLTINALAYELLINAIEHDLVIDCTDDLYDELYDDEYDERKTVELAMTELFECHPDQTARALRLLAAGALVLLHMYLMPKIDAILDRQSARRCQRLRLPSGRFAPALCPAA